MTPLFIHGLRARPCHRNEIFHRRWSHWLVDTGFVILVVILQRGSFKRSHRSVFLTNIIASPVARWRLRCKSGKQLVNVNFIATFASMQRFVILDGAFSLRLSSDVWWSIYWLCWWRLHTRRRYVNLLRMDVTYATCCKVDCNYKREESCVNGTLRSVMKIGSMCLVS